MIHREDLALYDDRTHIQSHIGHRCCKTLEGLAMDRFLGHRCLLLHGHRFRAGFHHIRADPLHCCKKLLALQGLTGFNPDLHRSLETGLQAGTDSGNAFFQCCLAVGDQLDQQSFFVPNKFRTGKAATSHGILLHEQRNDLFPLHSRDLAGWMDRLNAKLAKIIDLSQFPLHHFQITQRNIGFREQRQLDLPCSGIKVRSVNGRLRKRIAKRLRRHIVRKHIQKKYFFLHFYLTKFRFSSKVRAAIPRKAASPPALPSQRSYPSHRRRQYRYPPPGLHRGR